MACEMIKSLINYVSSLSLDSLCGLLGECEFVFTLLQNALVEKEHLVLRRLPLTSRQRAKIR